MTDKKPFDADRRSVLRGMSIVAAAGGLAACSKEDQEAAKSTVSDLGAKASSGAGEVSQSASSVVADGAVIPKSQVPVGSGFVDKAKLVVVSQPTEGQFKAFSNICTHQKCPMTKIDGDQMKCACHGSAFSLADGSVKNGPAEKPLDEKKVSVEGDNLKVT